MDNIIAKKNNTFLIISVLMLFSWCGHLNGTAAILANMAEAYPTVPMTSIYMLSTLVSLVSIPFSLISGWVADRFGMKKTLIIFLIILVVAGVGPAFITSFNAILVLRALVGASHGIIYPLPNVVATKSFPDEGLRSKVMGWGQLSICIFSVLISAASGYLANIDVRYAWYIYLVGIIAIVFAFFIPEDKKPTQATEKTSNVHKDITNSKEKMTSLSWFFIIATMLIVLFAYPFYLNVSSIISAEGLGTSVQAGYTVSLWTAGGAVGSFIFGFLYEKIKGYVGTVGSIIMFLGLACFAFGHSMFLMFVGAFVGGMGCVMMTTYMFLGISLATPISRVSTAMGIASAFLNGAAFVSGYFYPWISNLFGAAANLRFPFYISMIGLVTLSIFFVIMTKKQAKTV